VRLALAAGLAVALLLSWRVQTRWWPDYRGRWPHWVSVGVLLAAVPPLLYLLLLAE